MLLSVLLSVHLPVTLSQIRHVNSLLAFPLLQDDFERKTNKQSRKTLVMFTVKSELVMTM